VECIRLTENTDHCHAVVNEVMNLRSALKRIAIPWLTEYTSTLHDVTYAAYREDKDLCYWLDRTWAPNPSPFWLQTVNSVNIIAHFLFLSHVYRFWVPVYPSLACKQNILVTMFMKLTEDMALPVTLLSRCQVRIPAVAATNLTAIRFFPSGKCRRKAVQDYFLNILLM
jgi:hypothetical protein